MPRISTDNYDTVASWNGSQDLFVVEQPDGTKVATPAMVKQFMEAGDFTATGEIEDGHGNILKNMAKSADVNEVIGDLSQTGLTGDSVAGQLGDASGKIVNINTALTARTLASGSYKATSGNFEYVGLSYTCPAGKTAIIYGQTSYAYSKPIGLALSSSNSQLNAVCETSNVGNYVLRTPALMLTGEETVYLWDKRYDPATAANSFYIKGIVIG